MGLMLVVGCAPMAKSTLGTRVDVEVGNALIDAWAARSAQFTTMQGMADAKFSSPARNGGATQVVLVERPDHLRLETLSPFGTPLLLVTANGEHLNVLLPAENVFYRGAATPQNLGRFIRMPLKPGDMAALLLYHVPVLDGQRAAYRRDEGGWRVVVSSPGRVQEMVFDDHRQLIEVRYLERGELALRVAFGRFGAFVPGFPASFAIDLPEFETRASLDFSEQSVNRQFLPGIFGLQPPAGASVINLDHSL